MALAQPVLAAVPEEPVEEPVEEPAEEPVEPVWLAVAGRTAELGEPALETYPIPPAVGSRFHWSQGRPLTR